MIRVIYLMTSWRFYAHFNAFTLTDIALLFSTFCFVCFSVCWLLQTIFWTVIVGRIFYSSNRKRREVRAVKTVEIRYAPISIVVCARNEAENLLQFLPLVLQQNYAVYEVIVVNDGSTDETATVLKELQRTYSNLKTINLERVENRVLKGKKHALTVGIEAAVYDWILVTDADCAPNSPNWAQAMFAETQQKTTLKTQLVLGYSPYKNEKTALNTWIRFETVYTALQYMGLAAWGLPYMGVGRNMLYDKTLFLKNNGLAAHGDLLSGDDDLFVRDVATAENTVICLNAESFVTSDPKRKLADYLNQKKRHISTSTRYKLKIQVLLSLLSFSQLGLFLFFGLCLFFVETATLYLLIALFLMRWLCILDTLRRAKMAFRERFSGYSVLFCDVFLSFYLFYLSFSFLLPNTKRW